MAKTKKKPYDERLHDAESVAHKGRREEQQKLRTFRSVNINELDELEDEEVETFQPVRKKSNRN